MYDLSLIIPIFNEQDLISELYRRVSETLDKLHISHEVIVVSDGSTDQSVAKIIELRKYNSAWKIIELSKNFGHHSACTAGLDYARGKCVIFMDADLQDPPEMIAAFVEKWKEGYEIIYAVKKKRKESFFRRYVFILFYRVLNFLSAIDLPLDAGVFCLLDSKAAQALRLIKERHRYLAGLRAWIGFRQIAVPYEREERFAGTRKQTTAKLLSLAFDAIFSFSYIPLRLATGIGIVFAAFSAIVITHALYEKFITHQALLGWTSILGAVILTGGLILFMLGIIGEYIARIYDEIKERPIYLVRNFIGFDKILEAPPENPTKSRL
ncbi:MAG: glycosyltransferase family 2 protein [Elusimicrobia bacterium]|nr:glycosyltransferase family 2 protein [Elusimicrobiota bacterium]